MIYLLYIFLINYNDNSEHLGHMASPEEEAINPHVLVFKS